MNAGDTAGGRAPRGLGPRLRAALCVTVAALALLVGVTWVSTERVVEELRSIARTRRIVLGVDDTRLAWELAASGLRLFAATGRAEDQARLSGDVEELSGRLRRLAAAVGRDERHASRSARLEKAALDGIAELRTAVGMLDAGRRDDALATLGSVRGGRALDEIRRPVEEIAVDERTYLAGLEVRAQASVRALLGTFGVGAAALFGSVLVIWRLVRADLARRDLSEERRRAEEARFRRLVDSNLVGVAFSSPDAITEANDALLSILGVSRPAFEPGRLRLAALTAPEHASLDEAGERELRRTGVCPPFQKDLMRADGTRVPVLFGATLLDPARPDGERASFVVDLTELRRLEGERDRLYEEARDAVEARDAFLSVAGHEIRTPLSALNLLVYQLARRLADAPDARARELLGKAERQVARLVRLTDELLDVSRLTAGALPLDLAECDLAALAREVVERLEANARRAGCAVALAAPPALDGFWDRSRLDQVITNLLTNALKFGAGKPVELTLSEAGDVARLEVVDSGIGISAEDQARIFGRFQRAAAADAYLGLGLGLWITREIVEAHGGRIDVDSRPGAGARFVVELPRHGAPEGPR